MVLHLLVERNSQSLLARNVAQLTETLCTVIVGKIIKQFARSLALVDY